MDRESEISTALQSADFQTFLQLIEHMTSDELSRLALPDQRTPLHYACQRGRLDIAKVLITTFNCSIESKDAMEKSPAYLAAREGHLDVLRYLIGERGADLESYKCAISFSKSLIHTACQKGECLMVKYLIEQCGFDPSRKDDRWSTTPLHFASKHGHLDVVQYLVNTCRCDPQCVDKNYCTPLHYAAAGGNVDVVTFILLITDADRLPKDIYNNTPLHYAAGYNCLEVVKLYIEDMSCITDPNMKGHQDNTPLHLASRYGHLDVVKYLINTCHCDPLCVNKTRGTPLHLAATGGSIDVVKYILLVTDTDHLPKDRRNNTPLHYAVETKSIEVVQHICTVCRIDPYYQQLIEATDDPVVLQLLHDYTNPLTLAAEIGDLETVQLYIEQKGWDPLELDKYGLNVLHYAAENGHLEIVKYFAEEDLVHYDLNCKDQIGNTPLHLASRNGHLDVVKCLISSSRCNPVCRNFSRSTSLHLAASNNHLNVATFLSKTSQSHTNITNTRGFTPLHLAIENNHFEIAMHLIDLPHCNVLLIASGGITPLLLAVQKQQLEIVSYLCRTRRIDPFLLPERERLFKATNDPAMLEFLRNYPDPLQCAAIYGDIETVKYYIQREKWDPLKPDRYGNNILHNAAQHGQLEVIQYLTGLSKDPISEGVDILCNPTVKNKYGLTALDIASQNGHRHVVSYLLRATSNQLISEPDVLSPVLSIFVVGNSGSGKSTLVKALSSESSLLGAMVKVKGVTRFTAGIISTSLQSKMFGTVNIYDFAGHEEYYASHEMILSQTTQPLVLLAVDVSLPEQDVKKQVEYWLAILTNSLPADAKKTLHVLIVGSHADQIKFLERKDIYQHVTTWVKDSASLLKYHGFIQCDCRYPSSDNLKQLRLKLAIICKAIRLFLLANESDNSNRLCAALMYHLEHNKPQQATVTVRELFHLLTESISPGSGLAPFADEKLLLQTCKMLNFLGHLLFLPHDEREMDSVIILDKDTILSKVHACLKVIKKSLNNEIGILNEADLRSMLSLSLKGIMELELAIKYLIFSQFCTKVTASQLICIPENFTGLVHYFFPNLVSALRPVDLLPLGDQRYTHFYTWGLKCTKVNQFFTPRFLHTLFIQLTKCERDFITAIWKDGILLINNNGTRSILEVTDQTTQLHLSMQCVEGCESYLVKQRSALIHLVKSLLDKVCPMKLDTKEFFLLPHKTYPFNCIKDLPLNDVAQSVIDGSPTVVFNYENIPISKLLYFDSFHVIEDLTLRDILTRCQSTELVPTTTLNEVLIAVKGCEELSKLLKPEHMISYNQLYRELTKFSVFTEGNLYALVGVSASSQTFSSEEILPNLDPLGITDIYFINVNLIEVTHTWEFGRALGLKPHTLEKIKSCYFYPHLGDRCFVEVLAAWLNGVDRSHDSPSPNWGDVVTALISVGMRDHVQQLVQRLTNGNNERNVDVRIYSSIDNSELAPESLGELLEYMYDLSHKWFHLGLSLGLRYPTLKNIEASHYSDVKEQMTEMLNKWLRGVDQDTTRGVGGHPSWRTLAMALDCPLVQEGQASSKIRSNHLLKTLV